MAKGNRRFRGEKTWQADVDTDALGDRYKARPERRVPSGSSRAVPGTGQRHQRKLGDK